jgi:hypothetical protein
MVWAVIGERECERAIRGLGGGGGVENMKRWTGRKPENKIQEMKRWEEEQELGISK